MDTDTHPHPTPAWLPLGLPDWQDTTLGEPDDADGLLLDAMQGLAVREVHAPGVFRRYFGHPG